MKSVYKGRLLIVFPNGFGFGWLGHSSAHEYAFLSRINVQPGPVGLIESTRSAVKLLAADSGVELANPNGNAGNSRKHDRLLIIFGVLAALAAGALIRMVLRRR